MTQKELTPELIEQWEREPNAHQKLLFLTEMTQSFPNGTFPLIDIDHKKLFLSHLFDTWALASEQIRLQQLHFLRIILRDKNTVDLDSYISILTLLSRVAKLSADDFEECRSEPIEIVLESEKCLINLLFNSAKARNFFCTQKKPFDRLMSRIRSVIAVFDGSNSLFVGFDYLSEWSFVQVEELLLYDLKIAFITTALVQQLRNECVNDTNKTMVFLSVIICSLDKMSPPMATKCVNEALNTLFNIYHDSKVFELETAKKCADECARIVKSAHLDLETKQNAVNLLSVLSSALPSLCPKVDIKGAHEGFAAKDGYDMSFLNSLLSVFEQQIDNYEKKQIIAEFLGTHLTVLCHLCSEHKTARRFCREKVLPPLKEDDVRRRPGEGDSFRNKMVRLMDGSSRCSEMAAEFLFVLCKRSVGRLMKYCGFGHSAGLLANYGFLGQAMVAQRRPSDSEDSETDEYKRVEEKVDPVTGFIPPPEQLEEWRRQIDSMSEEQKEYEMMKLVDCMDKMMEQGMIKPGVIGEDGKLRQAKHVAELIKDVKEGEESEED
ncbi:hypothetical protein niasHT_023855 [Heterodera trifolii]|uniref:Synembryn n=1 Tax=Heterodera trifolii TaxID=157864 RepID=A0ABD2JCJ5_9BILA